MSVQTLSTTYIWLASGACILLASGVAWQKACKRRPEWVKGLDALGQSRKTKLRGTAVVCGASIAGTVTARILADHFERVILVDPEVEHPEKPKTRILQYNAGHVFLNLFVEGARRLWPNFDAELAAAGGRLVPADPQIHYSGILLPAPYQDYPTDCLPDSLVIRRATAQRVLQNLLTKHPTAANITLLPGTVRGLTASNDMASIEAVVVRKTDGTELVLGDVALIADCTGTTQAGLKWLRAAGFSLPENIRCFYDANLRYSTLCFSVPPALEAELPLPDDVVNKAALYAVAQHFEYGSSLVGLVKTEENTMQLVMCAGDDDDVQAPRIASDVVPFILGMRLHSPIPPWFLETVGILCERGNPSFDNIRLPNQSYIKYNSAPPGALPSNFIAIGDANLQLNPVHGQGFTKVVLNGLALNTLLASTTGPTLPRSFSARYFKTNAAYTTGLWDATRLHDYGTSGCRPMDGETRTTGWFMRWFEVKLVSAAAQDDEVASALWHVRHLLAADSVLMAPSVLWKVLWTRSLF